MSWLSDRPQLPYITYLFLHTNLQQAVGEEAHANGVLCRDEAIGVVYGLACLCKHQRRGSCSLAAAKLKGRTGGLHRDAADEAPA